MKISKVKFCEIMNQLKAQNEYADKIDDFVLDMGSHLKIDVPYVGAMLAGNGNQDLVIDLLELLMDDKDSWISWYVYEADFGRKEDYTSSVTEADGSSVDLSSFEKLYDFLDLTRSIIFS